MITSIRRVTSEIINRAAELGIRDAWCLGDMTLKEIELTFKAINANKQEKMRNMDYLAWRTGNYVLIALHAPSKYPRRI